jgi:hypothetical protein
MSKWRQRRSPPLTEQKSAEVNSSSEFKKNRVKNGRNCEQFVNRKRKSCGISLKKGEISLRIAVRETWTLKQQHKTIFMDMVYFAILAETGQQDIFFIFICYFARSVKETVLWMILKMSCEPTRHADANIQSPNLLMFKEPRNRFQETDSASLCSLAGRYVK